MKRTTLFIALICLFFSSCSQKAWRQIKANHLYNKDSTKVYIAHRRNPSVVINEYARMVKDGEVESRVVTIHDTVVVPHTIIKEVLKPVSVPDKIRENYLLDSMVNNFEKIVFVHRLDSNKQARQLESAEFKAQLLSHKNCPDLTGPYQLHVGKLTKTVFFKDGAVYLETEKLTDTTIVSRKEREVIVPAHNTVTEVIPWWIYIVLGILGAIILVLLTLKIFKK